MLCYDRIDIFQEIDLNKTNESYICVIICNYYYFLKVNFRFQPKLIDSCHNLMQWTIRFNDFTIVYVKESDLKIHFWYMSKDENILI